MALSRVLYRGLAAVRAPQVLRRARPGAPVFCFHNVVASEDAGAGEASLHLPRDQFSDILDWMCSAYEVVPLAELTRRARSGDAVGGLAAITFDDAYRGVFDHALPLLSAARVPCTIFVVSGFSDHPSHTWWDILASHGRLSHEERDHALEAQGGIRPRVLEAAGLADTDEDLPDVLLPAPWQEILGAMGDGVDIGSHTVRHANLSVLAERDLEEELGRSRREIGERTGREPEAVSYPYGFWNADVLDAARRAGYETGLTLDNRPMRGGEDPHRLPRINVPAGMSLKALECWSAGLRLRRPW